MGSREGGREGQRAQGLRRLGTVKFLGSQEKLVAGGDGRQE